MSLAKCSGEGCQIKEECERFTKPAKKFRQYYAAFNEYTDEQGCEYFIPNKKEK